MMAGHSIYDVLKDFQPFIAALVALSAATLAYRAAIAKVSFDKEKDDRERAAARIGLYLRLRSQLATLFRDTEEAWLLLHEIVPGQTTDWSSYRPKGSFDAVEAAWNSVHLLPYEAIEHLNQLRDELQNFHPEEIASQALHDLAPNDVQQYGVPLARSLIKDHVQRMSHATGELQKILEKATLKFRTLV